MTMRSPSTGENLPVEHLIKSMTPLYVGKTASFILEAQGHGAAGRGSGNRKTLYGVRKQQGLSGKQLEITNRRCAMEDFINLILEPLKELFLKFKGVCAQSSGDAGNPARRDRFCPHHQTGPREIPDRDQVRQLVRPHGLHQADAQGRHVGQAFGDTGRDRVLAADHRYADERPERLANTGDRPSGWAILQLYTAHLFRRHDPDRRLPDFGIHQPHGADRRSEQRLSLRQAPCRSDTYTC